MWQTSIIIRIEEVNMEQYDVFISYSWLDKADADDIYNALSKAGISCFLDKNLDNPDLWEVLVREIENCKIFLYLGSKNTAQARITPKELTYAINHKDRSCIYPYFIDDSDLPKVHEFLLADINWRKRSTFPIDTHLIPDLQKLLNQDPMEIPVKTLSGDMLPIVVGGQLFRMIRVDGGSMMIGATPEQCEYAEHDEYPAHIISLNPYYISQYPITQDVWTAVMGYNKSFFRYQEDSKQRSIESNAVADDEMLDNSGHYPVENISYDEALEFVRRLSRITNIRFDLPTEAEWEFAARGGRKSNCFRFAGSDNIDKVAWYKNNSQNSTHPVGEKQPNELGIYDMCGNVWEWTKTPAHSYATDIEPGGNMFIRRGGSWWHEERNCRVSRRFASDHSKKTSGLGMRVVIRDNVE